MIISFSLRIQPLYFILSNTASRWYSIEEGSARSQRFLYPLPPATRPDVLAQALPLGLQAVPWHPDVALLDLPGDDNRARRLPRLSHPERKADNKKPRPAEARRDSAKLEDYITDQPASHSAARSRSKFPS